MKRSGHVSIRLRRHFLAFLTATLNWLHLNDLLNRNGRSGHEAGDDGTVALFRLLSPPGTIFLLR